MRSRIRRKLQPHHRPIRSCCRRRTEDSPEERTLLGFPSPGHEYWTPETLEGVAARYPAMDMTPYEGAMIEKNTEDF